MNTMRILVVEDEKKVSRFVQRGFREHGFAADVAENGLDGFFMAEGEEYDCLVLDIMLPKLNGYEIVERLRKKGKKTPVIFLTAKDSVDDRVRGLELGGDDYLVKPFSFSELLARVRALVRRRGDKPVDVFKAGDIVLDTRKHIVQVSGKPVDLTPKEFTLLQYFLERPGEVITRTMLAENVWGYHFDSMTNVIDVHITNLRKKLDPGGKSPLIQTRRGVGYVFKK